MPNHHRLLGKSLIETDRMRKDIADEGLGARHGAVHENVLKPGSEVPGPADLANAGPLRQVKKPSLGSRVQGTAGRTPEST